MTDKLPGLTYRTWDKLTDRRATCDRCLTNPVVGAMYGEALCRTCMSEKLRDISDERGSKA